MYKAFWACCLLTVHVVSAIDVFAHVIVGNVKGWSEGDWSNNIQLAQAVNIDAFVLNACPPISEISSTVAAAFKAAESANFKLFFSFDYSGCGGSEWTSSDIINFLQTYGSSSAHYKYNEKLFASTFEGPDHLSDWTTTIIPDSSLAALGGVFFIPDYSSQDISSFIGSVDGAFSWNAWPLQPNGPLPDDSSIISKMGGKPYMMPISPWFYTDLPEYQKQWVFATDTLWHTRWLQAASLQPQFIEVLTWNDFGESHYIGPYDQAGVPANSWYVTPDYTHEAWRELLPWYISNVKAGGSGTPVTDEKAVFWYRLSSITSGDLGGVVGGQPPGTPAYDARQMMSDNVYVVVLLKDATDASVTVTIGSGQPQTNSTLSAGANLLAFPFGTDTGEVSVSVIRGGQTIMSGTGKAIETASGTVNLNAYVGSAQVGGDGQVPADSQPRDVTGSGGNGSAGESAQGSANTTVIGSMQAGGNDTTNGDLSVGGSSTLKRRGRMMRGRV